ncbi:glycerophosphodiester phosphodiesterase family protein [Homoserinibacter sp. YIM 151385]|uniref:glycerophosphodiester phosphodiesterase family protein n=1 Tax=Homoserinibacter sp. YIM 151385 TaxID=2985506 RepID=UPI0022F124B7|nr:glycerophosphodiester phosphodiesterase family protein [Homoserinibacter sp. YIM 151385]WBU37739.1 glycerophosphodiester phosphodiesterase family protein [Homoserinibacter sp. YIM 151385]
MTRAARPQIIGHRGASGWRPEHTREAYELAFALGADLVEPDLVATRDGVLVIRHENEISGTTDVASHPELAHLRTAKEIEGRRQEGWFTEDLSWAQLQTLRAVERLPRLRPASTAFDGRSPILRLEELLALVDEWSARQDRPIGVVAEIKHADYFDSIGLPLDELAAPILGAWAAADPARLIVESFEQTVLERLRERGLPGRRVYLVEDSGSPADLRARHGRAALPYAAHLTDAGLARLAATLDGVSVAKPLLVSEGPDGVRTGDLVDRIHRAGLEAYLWTLRPENRFLLPSFRRGRSPREHGDWMGEFQLVMRTGLDGVFLDHPDLGVAARAALAERAE